MPKTQKTEEKAENKDLQDLEIKDAQIIFENVWDELVRDSGSELHFPTEIFWVNGAPGAGKGTHTATMMDYRGFTAPPIVISDLLHSPEAQQRKDAGLLVGDTEVCSLLLRKLLHPVFASGAVVDGFPRTMVQVAFLKLFHNKLKELSSQSTSSNGVLKIRKPNFHILVLFVDEEESVRRQLDRGKKSLEHNREVESSGMGEKVAIRKTDFDPAKARNRYRVFKEHTYEPLKSLREIFHFHFVNTQTGIKETRDRIVKELEYQSSLELSQETFQSLSTIPLANEIIKHARQQLIERLEDYQRTEPSLFNRIVKLINTKFMPIIERHAISGRAQINTEDTIFQAEHALPILIDIFSERGYHASVDIQQEEIPYRFDSKTFEIETRYKRVYRVYITFQGSEIRRGH